jgi:hypothetical protein
MRRQTSQCKFIVYNMFNLKAPFFKGGWGDQENLNLLMGVFRIRPALHSHSYHIPLRKIPRKIIAQSTNKPYN